MSKWMKRALGLVLSLTLLLSVALVAGVTASADGFTKSAMEFAAQINCGWIPGNSLDVAEDWGGETGWGNPELTKDVFDAVAEKGFNAVRIPITWFGSSKAANTGAITETRMDRAQEVVDWAMENDLFVIINAHHENEWLKASAYDFTQEQIDTMLATYTSMWEQIATRFKDYDEKLIFESHNEVRDNNDWTGYEEAYDLINQINAAFVETVRATGGNNAMRYLLIDGYANSSSPNAVRYLDLPADPANHLMVSIHSYSPQNFAFPPSTSGSNDQIDFIYEDLEDALIPSFEALTERFAQYGVPVIIGEMGSVDKDNTEDRIEHITAFVKLAGEYGFKCFWWDNNAFGHSADSESFGLLDRSTLEWENEIADAMINEANKYVGQYPATVTSTSAASTSSTSSTAPSGDYQIVDAETFGLRYSGGWEAAGTLRVVNEDRSFTMWSEAENGTNQLQVYYDIRNFQDMIDMAKTLENAYIAIDITAEFSTGDPEEPFAYLRVKYPKNEEFTGGDFDIVVESGKTLTYKVPISYFTAEETNALNIQLNNYNNNFGQFKLFEPTATVSRPYIIYYSDEPVVTSSTAPSGDVVYGDVNGDNEINAKDSLALRQYIAKYEVADFDAQAADVNADGKINSRDSLLLRQYIAKYNVVLGPQS